MIRTQRPEAEKALAFLLAALVAVSLMLFITTKPAHAKTFTVNSTLDTDDGACSPPRGLGLECTLREAIKAANNAGGKDAINFNIFGSGVKTIKPNSELPTIADQVTINGYTQPGPARTPL